MCSDLIRTLKEFGIFHVKKTTGKGACALFRRYVFQVEKAKEVKENNWEKN